MKMRFIIIILFCFAFSQNFAQNDTVINDTTSIKQYNNQDNNSKDYDYLKQTGELQFKLQQLRTEVEEQRFYKFIFMGLAAFMVLIGIFIVYVFYIKAKKTDELVKIQDREIKLRENQINSLSVLLNYSDNAILLASAEGEIKWLNGTFEKLYGYNLDELKQNGKGNYLFNFAENEEKIKIAECISNKSSLSFMVSTDGKQKYKLRRTIIPIIGAKGEVNGFALSDSKVYE